MKTKLTWNNNYIQTKLQQWKRKEHGTTIIFRQSYSNENERNSYTEISEKCILKVQDLRASYAFVVKIYLKKNAIDILSN